MDATTHVGGKEVSDSIRDAMRSAAIRAGWSMLQEMPALTLEQEQVEVKLPDTEKKQGKSPNGE
jgi:hypothetical protein